MLALARLPPAGGADEAQARARLAEVRTRIEEISRALGARQVERDEVAASLRSAELSAAALAKELGSIRLAVGTYEQELATLAGDKSRQTDLMSEQRRALAAQIRASYLLGRDDRLKLMLNQEDPGKVARALAYAGYFQRARVSRIQALGETVARLHATEAEIQTVSDRLRAAAEDKRRLGLQLSTRREQRQQVLRTLEAQIQDDDRTLMDLRRDESELASLVEAVAREMARLSLSVDDRAAFSSLKGRLPWPSSGGILHRFGTPREGSDLTWQGVVIVTEAGEPVRAISHGRVAYADWLRGFGLLMIVDHGDGYMSLYGYNESLLKEVGEWVDAGEAVATVGDSGGRREPGVYFEIRRSGIPVDPGGWCAKAVEETALVTAWQRPVSS